MALQGPDVKTEITLKTQIELPKDQIIQILKNYYDQNLSNPDSWYAKTTPALQDFQDFVENKKDINIDHIKQYVINTLAPQFTNSTYWILGMQGNSTLKQSLLDQANSWPSYVELLKKEVISFNYLLYQDVLERAKEIEKTLDEKNQQCSTQEELIETMKKQLEALYTEIKTLKTQNESLKIQNDNLKKTNITLNAQNLNLTTGFENYKKSLDEQSRQNNSSTLPKTSKIEKYAFNKLN